MAAKKGQKFPPIYEQSFETAVELGEAEQYNASHALNVECARAINKALGEHYRDNCLDTTAASREVVNKFGFERTMYVLASTVRHFDHDGRISYKNKKWALTIPNYDDKQRRGYYLVTNHPGLTDMLVDQVRHDYLLTQPLKAQEVKAEAERILTKFQSLREPNSPNGEQFEVGVSPIFMERAKPKQMERLASLLGFQSLKISNEGGRDTYIIIDKDENRNRPLQLRKPSVKAKLEVKPVPGDHPAKPKNRETR